MYSELPWHQVLGHGVRKQGLKMLWAVFSKDLRMEMKIQVTNNCQKVFGKRLGILSIGKRQ